MTKRITSPARLWWKMWWRQTRIIRRETMKQWEDTIIFGIGYAEVGEDVPDFIRHIPIQQIHILRNE